jgi:hypothetical protein
MGSAVCDCPHRRSTGSSWNEGYAYLDLRVGEFSGGMPNLPRYPLMGLESVFLRVCFVDRPISDFSTPVEILLFGRPVL